MTHVAVEMPWMPARTARYSTRWRASHRNRSARNAPRRRLATGCAPTRIPGCNSGTGWWGSVSTWLVSSKGRLWGWARTRRFQPASRPNRSVRRVEKIPVEVRSCRLPNAFWPHGDHRSGTNRRPSIPDCQDARASVHNGNEDKPGIREYSWHFSKILPLLEFTTILDGERFCSLSLLWWKKSLSWLQESFNSRAIKAWWLNDEKFDPNYCLIFSVRYW